MSRLETIVRSVLDEGVDDWVPIDSLIWEAREAAGDSDFRVLVADALRLMFAEGLVVAGHVGGPEGFLSEGSSDGTLAQVIADCASMNWNPQGGGYWLANTDKGDRYVADDV
ncbi:hypothetical protein G4X40_02490 [Rhodococcus sp. D2-41]|uniref:Uncharacterized protein n=1 Tax=Speluncibacter jeojiensis TaxID=2710754 RepID=A0A9X4M026_9ACTN|nr:hypothetical protein [Rhodococcus sp. D2-41]MDG3009014.1 hypothetical protein [Rhodococcus sp. D2-41]MDG3015525.1 hypothetical protein [Corynebacteriales bacterium D3-21]